MGDSVAERAYKARCDAHSHVNKHLSSSEMADLHSRVSVLEQQIVDQKEATVLALAAADKAILSAVVVADKAVVKVELAAEKTYLEASILGLKEAFDKQILHQKELTAQSLASSNQAVLKAENSTEKRFESVNEFRATLSDQQNMLATKSEVNLRMKALEDRMNAVVEDTREMKGHGFGVKESKDERSTDKSQIIAMVSVVIALATLVLVVIRATILAGH